ncbi:MAG: hypothetical protein A2V66_10105 [Ignavibacteria bacterium RBG_13_36_8]|nr:MAG: hypothetical protein A2V66_10105 [Ignavibacteria bacterium RBG_13_36_8]
MTFKGLITSTCFLFVALSVQFFITHTTLAQRTGTLRGVVTDSTNSEALAFANIYIKELGTGASVDTRGYFLIPSILAGKNYKVTASYIGYITKEINVFISENKITHIDIELSPSSIQLQTVEKVGEKVMETNATDIGLQRIALRDLEALPKGVETDLFRSLQYMPGVRTTSDISARYYVRGSASNQNLVLLEGTTVYNPFHAMGLFSAIDPDIINNVEFYKGGFTSEYGGRISSVLSVVAKEGNKNNYTGSASISMLTGKLMVEGPIPRGSFVLSGRKSYSTVVLNKFLKSSNIPVDFYDLFFKANYADLDSTGSKFTFYGFLSNDNIFYDDPLKADFKWTNNLFGLKWFYVGDVPLYIEIGASMSNFKGEVIQNMSKAKPQLNKLNDVTLDASFNYIFSSKDEVLIGIQIKEVKTELYIENSRGAISDIGTRGSNINAFLKYKFLRYENFGADVGMRFMLTRLAGGGVNRNAFEPRISLTYRFIPQIALKAAFGIYQQDLTTMSDESEVISLFEPWIIIPENLNPSESTQYSMGVELNLFDNLSVDVETYYKDIKNLLAINQNKIYSTDPDFVAGTGESYGVEFLARYNPSPISITAAYTLAWAYKEVEGWVYYPRYDSRNTLNLSLEYNFGSGWLASIVWNYSSGLPFTQLVGYYDKLYLNDPNNPSDIIESVSPFALLGDLNLGRLPDYHRLDFTVSKKFAISFMNFDLSVSVLNIYDRKNIFYFDRKTGERVNSLPFLPTATFRVEL